MLKIHKEGYRIIGVIAATLFICLVLASVLLINKIWILLPLIILILLLMLFILRFFRIPQRKPVYEEGVFYSPADGKIVVIEETFEDEFLKEKRIQVSVFMSVWDVHINFFPLSGKVIYYKYHPGKFLIARYPKSSTLNERTTIVIENNKYGKVLVRQIAGAIARRIICYATVNKNFFVGDEIGFIKFGSRVDIFLPLNANIHVKSGDHVKGGLTPVATI